MDREYVENEGGIWGGEDEVSKAVDGLLDHFGCFLNISSCCLFSFSRYILYWPGYHSWLL